MEDLSAPLLRDAGRYVFLDVSLHTLAWHPPLTHWTFLCYRSGTKPTAISKEEVKNLFQLWNSALATEDPDAVAKRYSSNAVLLPTVSDVPRTDYALIKDYFVGFLKKK